MKLRIMLMLLVVGTGCALAQKDARNQHMDETAAALKKIITTYGGLQAIEQTLTPLRTKVGESVASEQTNGMAFKKGAHFFNFYMTTAAMKSSWLESKSREAGKTRPIDVVVSVKDQLAALGVALIVVPIPAKIEAYPEPFGATLPTGHPVSLARLELMQALLNRNVETIDVLPSLLEAKHKQAEPCLYEYSGHHLSGRGGRLVGDLIGSYLDRFQLAGRDKSQFSDVRRKTVESIDRSIPMPAWQVLHAGKRYEHAAHSPIVTIGDSQLYAFGAASLASHIARSSGIQVTDLAISGGGAAAHLRLADLGTDDLKQRKVVLWVCTSAFFDQSGWDSLFLSGEPTVSSLVNKGYFAKALAAYLELDPQQQQACKLIEDDLNGLGYRLLGENRTDEAIAVFRINTLHFHQSPNTFDSLGEAYKIAGQKDKAIASFKQCLAMYPAQGVAENSNKLLKELGVDWQPPPRPQLSAEVLNPLTGTYETNMNMEAVIALDDNKLYLHLLGRPKIELMPITEKRFNTAEGMRFLFADEAGKCTIWFRDQKLTARRTSPVPESDAE